MPTITKKPKRRGRAPSLDALRAVIMQNGEAQAWRDTARRVAAAATAVLRPEVAHPDPGDTILGEAGRLVGAGELLLGGEAAARVVDFAVRVADGLREAHFVRFGGYARRESPKGGDK